ncbi:hypothetical protein I6A62_36880, partial [Frankia sp. AgW1.1]|nr:hypothetical protein [Frankia sp. AgW1.1]
MKILVDGGTCGSGGYLHHLRGVLNAQPPSDLQITLLVSARLAERLGPVGAHRRGGRPPG